MSRQCRTCGSPVSDSNVSQDCGRHNRGGVPRNLQMGITPKGSAYLRRGAPQVPGTLPRKLQSERQPPVNSAGVYGFPYFTHEDRYALEQYLATGNPNLRPPAEAVMDRFPIQTRMAPGASIPDSAVGIFDSRGNFWHLNGYAPENGSTSGVTVMMTESGERFSASHNREYQIVELDLRFRQQ